MGFVVFQQLGVALGLASLIGLERERRYQSANYQGFAGLRTFALIGLTGALAYILSAYSSVFFSVLTAGFLALVVAGYVMSTKADHGAGSTSEVAAILVYLIGVLAAMEQYLLATSITLGVLVILQFRDPLHRWAMHLKKTELVSTVEFIIIAFIILPLLPNQAYGLYDFFNPYVVWLMVVLISGVSFISYVAIKILGENRGICLTGFLAGFLSSTALAFSFSAQSRKNTKIVNPYVLAIVISSTAMFVRVFLLVVVLNAELARFVAIPLGAMVSTGALASWYLWRNTPSKSKGLQKHVLNMRSPFSIVPAMKFVAFFTFILFLTKFAIATFGNEGIYLTGVFSGFLDVDAITVSMANLSQGDLPLKIAAVAIVFGVMSNTVTKILLFLFFGGREVGMKIFRVFSLVLVVGIVSLIFI